MKMKKICFPALLFVFILSGCFKDNGNYEYEELNPPKWLFDAENTNIRVYCRAGAGEKAVFKASDKYTWESDSLRRESEVRFEWKLNGVVIGDKADFEIPTDSLIKKIKLKELPDRGIMGTFAIIKKSSGVSFMVRSYVTINPEFGNYDWYAISELGEETKFSVIKRRTKYRGEESYNVYELDDNTYKRVNGRNIPGKPLDLVLAKALNVGPVGSSTVITDKVAYVVDNSTMKKAWELKEQFLDGPPADFEVTARYDQDGSGEYGEGAYTFVATKDGKVYTRTMSPNYLGGKFLKEPYYMDNKGYHVTRFGKGLQGLANIPCYDEKNRRVLIANVWRVDINHGGGMGDNTSVYRCRLFPLTERFSGVPVWEMPEGTKVWHIAASNHLIWGGSQGTNAMYDIFYTTADGKSIVGSFVVSNRANNNANDFFAAQRWNIIPNVTFDKDTRFLTSGNHRSIRTCDNAKYVSFYTKGNEIRYIKRSKNYAVSDIEDKHFVTVASKVTYLAYMWFDCEVIAVGCENGDVYFYDITQTVENPKLESQVNLGGKVVALKMVGQGSAYHDKY